MSHSYLAYFDQDDLPITPNLSFTSIEQHLSEVTSFWATGKLDELVQSVKKLLDVQIYDIRLLVFYFYSLWASDEYDCSLDEVLIAFQQLLKQSPQVWLLPEEDTKQNEHEAVQKQLQICLNLFFNRVEQRLARFANQPEYEEQHPCRIIQQSDQFATLLEQHYQLTDIVPLIAKINPYFSDDCEQKMAEAAALKEAETHMDNVPTDEKDDKTINEIADEKRSKITDTKTSTIEPTEDKPTPPNNTHHYSPALQQLLHKMQIFEILMQENNTYKAAIVFENIQRELQQFNPLYYLPELFSGYAKTHALHAVALNQLIQQHDGIQSQALKDYFAIDPNGFLQLEIDAHPATQHVDHPDSMENDFHNRHAQFADEHDDF